MSGVNVHWLIDVAESTLKPSPGVVDGDEEPLDDRREKDQRHGDAEEGVEYAEDFALTGQRGLVAIA